MRCNGAGLAGFHKWTVYRPGPLIAAVIRLETLDPDGLPTHAYRP